MKTRTTGQALKDRRKNIISFLANNPPQFVNIIALKMNVPLGAMRKELYTLIKQGKITRARRGYYTAEPLEVEKIGSALKPIKVKTERKTLTAEITVQVKKHCKQNNLVFIEFIEETILEKLVLISMDTSAADIQPETFTPSNIGNSIQNIAEKFLEYFRSNPYDTFTTEDMCRKFGIAMSTGSGRLSELCSLGYIEKVGTKQRYFLYQLAVTIPAGESQVYNCIKDAKDFINRDDICEQTGLSQHYIGFYCKELQRKLEIHETRPWVFQILPKISSTVKIDAMDMREPGVAYSTTQSEELPELTWWEKFKSIFS